ncbi:MAG: hypothetical protein K2X74_04835 [Acetobacteraceae bacterium]|nr:hypothetical protein [Acetobacteraceae bacterium]
MSETGTSPEPHAATPADIRSRRLDLIIRQVEEEREANGQRLRRWKPAHWTCVTVTALAPIALAALSGIAPIWVIGGLGFTASVTGAFLGFGRTGQRLGKAEETDTALRDMRDKAQDLKLLSLSADPDVGKMVDDGIETLRARLSETRQAALPAPPDVPRLTGPPTGGA